MFNSVIIDTLIGLILMYASLSLVASGITEIVGTWLKTRPKLLEQAIGQLLGDKLFEHFYSHPRIALLTKEPDDVSEGMKLPSSLSSSTFSRVLILILRDRLDIKARSITGNQLADEQVQEVSDLTTLRDAIENRLKSDEIQAEGKSGPLSDAEKRLLTMILDFADQADAAGHTATEKIDAFHKELEEFYNELMDRVSGWFRRKTHLIAVIVAIIVCALMNADTLQVARTLSSSPELRANLVKAAVNAEVATKNVAGKDCSAFLDIATPDDKAPKTENLQKFQECQRAALEIRLSQAGTAFPIGWIKAEMPAADLLPWSMKILGVLISGFAVSLGAAFWFNILKDVMRLTGKVSGKEAPQST